MNNLYYRTVLDTIGDSNKRLMWLKRFTRPTHRRKKRARELLNTQQFLWKHADFMKNDRLPLQLEQEFL